LQAAHDTKQVALRELLAAEKAHNAPAAATAKRHAEAAERTVEALHEESLALVAKATRTPKKSDNDRVFLSFILTYLPRGVIGFLLAMVLCASMSSIAAEQNSLAAATVIDIYKRMIKPSETSTHYLLMSKWFTLLWGVIAIGFALVADRLGSLIEAVNTLGSLFYGAILGVFMVGVLLKRVQGTAVFSAAICAEAVVLLCFWQTDIAYLWYNALGCLVTVALAIVFQQGMGKVKV